MKPTTTIAVLCLVVAGASAMNPPSNQQSDSPDAADSSQSSRRTGLRYTWNKKTKGPQSPDVQARRRMSSNMKQSHHETPHEEQQSTESPPDEKSDASPSMTNVHQETPRTHSSSTSFTNQWKKLASKSKEEREKRARTLQKRVGVTYKEYVLVGEKYHLEYSRIDPEEVRNPADRELLRNKCAQLEVYAYDYKLAFYMLRLFERTMSELEKVESGEETDETGSDDMPTRPVLMEQKCKKLYAELYRQSD